MWAKDITIIISLQINFLNIIMLQILFISFIISVVSCESCTLGDVRFSGGTDASNGLLEMCNSNSTWTEVCGWSFSCNDAIVACRKAGYIEAISEFTRYAHPRELTEFGLYSCTGSESSLLDCPLDTFWRSGGALEDLGLCGVRRAGVKCVQSIVAPSCGTEDAIRLINGLSESEGQLQICKNQYWREVCTSSDNAIKLGTVACRQLGYTDTLISVSYNRHYYNSSINPQQFTRINCYDSTYENVSYCSISSKCVQCKGSEVSVKCDHQPTNCVNGDLRLFGGPTLLEGFLEICVEGVWGGVINNIEGITEDIACASMGFNETGASVIRYHNYERNHSPVLVKYINCCEDDKNFEDCNIHYVDNDEDSFNHNNLLGLRCIDGCTAGNMRLTGGDSIRTSFTEGVVELCVDGTWTLVGLDSWDDMDANVVCQNINTEKSYASFTAMNSSNFQKSHRPIRYDRFRCIGTESSLLNCGKSWHYASNDESVAAVACGCSCGSQKRSVGLEMHNGIKRRNVDEESLNNTSCNNYYEYSVVFSATAFVGGCVFGVAITGLIAFLVILSVAKKKKLNTQKYQQF